MSSELRRIEIACTVNDSDHLPKKHGRQLYADDVVAELRDVVSTAVTDWYERRGRELLACEPEVG